MQQITLSPVASSCTASEGSISLLARYNSYFRNQPADTPSLIRTAQAIRYQVYCLERGFESAGAHGDGLERDTFDDAAFHSLVIHRPTSDAIGTARLILPQRCTVLPFQELLAENGLRARDYLPLGTAAEVSRFAISNQFRRCRSDGVFATDDVRHTREAECRGSLPCLGLVREVTRQSLALGLTHWVAVMEPSLLRRLARIGIHFRPVGPLVSHHGLRQPSYACIAEVLERLKREQPENWMVVTDEGAPASDMPAQRRAA
jgi:N-acyl amino acid synthase of PEP-CTERM/exosortase system